MSFIRRVGLIKAWVILGPCHNLVTSCQDNVNDTFCVGKNTSYFPSLANGEIQGISGHYAKKGVVSSPEDGNGRNFAISKNLDIECYIPCYPKVSVLWEMIVPCYLWQDKSALLPSLE